ncbi:MAG TPA: metalloregulator ArsR/SmtB family transcription factor [Candidatus Dormibacteraeota bacterium]|nr:metalloregulator ArsR/SmtB family transcription factor [Candidatus Dormibacteraeota bacterium]
MSPARKGDLDRTLAALADPYRRRTIDLLRERPRRAGELAQVLQLPAPAMSRHLRVLRLSGLVEEAHPEFDARVRIYELRPEPIAGLKAWLEETEKLWTEQLAAFKAHVERR